MERDARRNTPSPADGLRGTGARLTLVQAAMRRRLAERAVEEYVRDMARRWTLVPDPDEGEPGGSLP